MGGWNMLFVGTRSGGGDLLIQYVLEKPQWKQKKRTQACWNFSFFLLILDICFR